MLTVTEINSLFPVIEPYILGSVEETNNIKSFITFVLGALSEAGSAYQIHPYKTFIIKNVSEIGNLSYVVPNRITVPETLQESSLLFSVDGVPDFHEVQEFLLRVTISKEYVFELVMGLPFNLEIAKGKEKVLIINNSHKTSLIITTKQQLDLGG